MKEGISSKRVEKLAKKSTPQIVKTIAEKTESKEIVKGTECKKKC